jgi:hypothetical protein
MTARLLHAEPGHLAIDGKPRPVDAAERLVLGQRAPRSEIHALCVVKVFGAADVELIIGMTVADPAWDHNSRGSHPGSFPPPRRVLDGPHWQLAEIRPALHEKLQRRFLIA